MKKSVLSFLLIPLFMVIFGFSAFAGEFYCEVDTDYEYDDIYIEVGETDNDNEAYIELVNDSEVSIFIGTDSLIFVCDEEGNPIEPAVDTFADDLVEIEPGDSWTYLTGELDDNMVFAAGILVVDEYGDMYTFSAGFGFAD